MPLNHAEFIAHVGSALEPVGPVDAYATTIIIKHTSKGAERMTTCMYNLENIK